MICVSLSAPGLPAYSNCVVVFLQPAAYLRGMKHLFLLFCFITLLAYKVSAQTESSVTNAQNSIVKKNTTNNPPPKASNVTGLATIPLKDIHSNLGKFVQVCDVVYGYRVLDTLEVLAFGAAYPNQALTVVLYGKAFDALKASNVVGKRIVVTGIITADKEGKDPQMIVSDSSLIHIY